MRGEKKVGQFKKIVRGITAGLMSAAVLMSGMVSTDIGLMQANAAGPNRTATPPEGAPETEMCIRDRTWFQSLTPAAAKP